MQVQRWGGLAVVLSAITLGDASQARAGAWAEGFHLNGVEGSISDQIVFDDGSGPELFVIGAFTISGNEEVTNIAKWDGTNWTALGMGIGTYVGGTAFGCLAVFDDGSGPALYAGGFFSTASGVSANSIAKWNGTTWSALGSGLTLGVPGSAKTYALAVFDDGGGPALYAGGEFTTAGGVSANNIAKWNGSSWSALGSGIDGSVYALTVFNDGGGAALYAGGGFATAGGVSANYIAKWNGSAWSALGSGVDGLVSSITVFNGGGGPAPYAGGNFTTAGGVSASNIAKWNGLTWSPLGSGVGPVTRILPSSFTGTPTLYVSEYGITPNVAGWNGSIWTTIGVLDGAPFGNNVGASFAIFDDGGGPAMYVGGQFNSVGPVGAASIARWDGASWSPLGDGDGISFGVYSVFGLSVFDNGGGSRLYAVGKFQSAGAARAKSVASFDGSSWQGLGTLDDQFSEAFVYAIDGFMEGGNPAVYAGGGFQRADGANVFNIARWNGTGWSGLNGGTNRPVRALTHFDDGGGMALYAGGDFTTAGGVSAKFISKWNGTTWSALGSGINCGCCCSVLALTTYDDGGGPALYVGGGFTTGFGAPANGIAKWNGSTWSPLGTGMDGTVVALATYDDGGGPALYAGGSFTTAGGVSANGIAKWNGSTWSPLGSEIEFPAVALATYDDGGGPALYAAGTFNSGGVEVAGVAKWDGSNWTALCNGVTHDDHLGSVYALAAFTYQGYPALFAGGGFDHAGAQPSSNIAAWTSIDDCNGNCIDDLTEIADCTGDPACSDCNGNSILDECEIADCAGDPACDDCNLNDVPDGCDVPSSTGCPAGTCVSGCSADLDEDCVPDECQEFTGACMVSGQEQYWTCPANWDLGGQYPDDSDSAADVSVTLPGGAVVFLDDTVAIPSLRIKEGAELLMTAPGEVGDLDVTRAMLVKGTLTMANYGKTLDVASKLKVGAGGIMRFVSCTPSPSCEGTPSSILADDLFILGNDCDVLTCPAGGDVTLEDSVTATTTGDLVLNGFHPDEIPSGATAGLTPPPKLRVRTNSTVSVAGSLIMKGVVECKNDSTQEFSLAGEMDNQLVLPSLFDWATGQLTLNGSGLQVFEVAGIDFGTNVEGFDTDADTLFDTDHHLNFSIGTLEVAAGRNIEFRNAFANTVTAGACQEALYVGELVLRAGATMTLNNVKVYYGGLVDEGAAIMPLGCGGLSSVAPPPQIVWDGDPFSPNRTSRSLMLFVAPPATATGSPGQAAIKVTMVDLGHPSPANSPANDTTNYTTFDTRSNGVCVGGSHDGHHCDVDADCRVCVGGTAAFLGRVCTSNADCGGAANSCPAEGLSTCSNLAACTAANETNGYARWVGEPKTYAESQNIPGLGTYRAARLQCTPYYHDWGAETVGGPITVVGAEIIPSSTYSVQALSVSCKGSEESCTNTSPAVEMITRRYGDVVGPFNPPTNTAPQPDGSDVVKVVDKFKNQPSAPGKAITLLQPNYLELNGDVSGSDIVQVVDAFKLIQYRFPGPCPCSSLATCGALACPGGDAVCKVSALPGLGAGATCIKTCSGGDNAGDPCVNDSHCPGGGVGSCGNPLCRDKCGRCTP